MNIFVTGASGFVGNTFVERLKDVLKKEDKVFLLLRRYKEFSDGRFEQLIGDLDGIDRFKDKILECDYFFHIAANATFGNKEDYENINHKPTKNIVNILKKSRKLKDFIFISTIGAVDRHKDDDCKEPLQKDSIPSPKSKYGESKLKSESYIRQSGIPYTIIRPTWVYGKNMRNKSHINLFVTMICQDNIATKIDFPGKVSLIHVDDLARSLVGCIDNKKIIGKTYFAETESKSLGEIFNIIRRKVHHTSGGKDIDIKGVENDVRKKGMIPMPSFKIIMRRIHRFLPVTVNNLFIDYLYARDDEFRKDLLNRNGNNNKNNSSTNIKNHKNTRPIRFIDGVDDVIATNTLASGYWIITGANSGIGLALARKLKAAGKRLILIDKDMDVLSKEFGPSKTVKSSQSIMIIKTDLSEISNIKDVADRISQSGYPIYCLVNNAGIGYRKSFDRTSMDEIQKIIAVNIKAYVYLTKLLLDKMKKEGSVIVNVASSVAYNPLPNMLLYSSTKAFISNWSESLSYELKDTNKVITFSPSGTNTRFQEKAGVKKEDAGKGLYTPDQVADRIINAVRKDQTVVIVGFKTKILLMAASILPRRLNILLWGKLFEKMR